MSASIQDVIPRLKNYNESSFPILSVYITVSENSQNIDKKLDEILKRDLSNKDKKTIRKNIEYIKGVFQEEKGSKTKSYAFFSGGSKLFEILHLPFRIKDQALLSHSPFLEPILHAQDAFRLYLLVVLDRAKAKFFLLNNGTVINFKTIFDLSVPQKVHADGEEAMHAKRSDKTDRHIKDHLNRHYKLIVEKLNEFASTTPIAGVIIGGHKTLFSSFEKLLPYVLQKKVVGEFIAELNTNDNQILQRAHEIIEKTNRSITHQNSPFMAI
jgi:peptide subunit release factor 1 (eRF1)